MNERVHEAKTANPATTFLSCSVRRKDQSLVDALHYRVLQPLGFQCITVGRNASLPEQPDDAIKKLLAGCHCLVGIATERFEAVDGDFCDRTLRLATPYLLQETAQAFQLDIPFLVFKTPQVSLQGVTSRNLYIEIEPQLTPTGTVRFKARRQLVQASLEGLKAKAVARRKAQTLAEWKSRLTTAAAIVVGGYGAYKGIDWLQRPDCRSDFYYRDPNCKTCDRRPDCRAEKASRRG